MKSFASFSVMKADSRDANKIITENITASHIESSINSEIATAIPERGFPIRSIAKIE